MPIDQLALEMSTLFFEESDEKTVLVAGQALAVWGMYYLGPHIPLEQLYPLASRDIDFYNTRKSGIQKYAQLMCEYLKKNNLTISEYFPPQFDPTINVASWVISDADKSGDSIVVDFINYISGIKTKEIESPKNVDTIKIDAYSFNILSPTMCLKARINNLIRRNSNSRGIAACGYT